MGLTRLANRFLFLTGPNHRIEKIEISGDMKAVQELHKKGARILFIANHPSHSDPQLMIEAQRRAGNPIDLHGGLTTCFCAGKGQAWFMQKMGSFSIDREGSDRKAMSAAIDTLKKRRLRSDRFPRGKCLSDE